MNLTSLWCQASYIKSRPGRPSGPKSSRCRNCRWSSPSTGSFKIDVDGARNPSLGLASSTTVAKDVYGRWLWGIGRNIRRRSVEQVFMVALKDKQMEIWSYESKNCTDMNDKWSLSRFQEKPILLPTF
ncbi:hypothetical protein J1N35_042709 [Gossypium stocksii]|uniref:RNase H type-1 domain-containing protein n=1 Tax=Gossypium stocksii TaxID=47602 RepID=A0A9D3U5Z6_9ROSI|nr:hypothetical protein J1N35_042709 [Gossypium stocksii]